MALRIGDKAADQRAHHGFAWIATSAAALEAMAGWLATNHGGSELDRQVAQLGFAETVGQLIDAVIKLGS